MTTKFTFIDLFAGIGGFHEAIKGLGGKCVAVCELDKYERETYIANYDVPENKFFGDINNIKLQDIPRHNMLCAGFPCQPFSQAGFKQGFNEARGTLFFEIVKIIKNKQPDVFFLENVRHLLHHDSGNTLTIINKIITSLGYSFHYKIIKASDFGLPQHRPRLFMVGFRDIKIPFEFTVSQSLDRTMSDIWGAHCPKKIGFTLRVDGRGSPLTDRRNWNSYLVDGEIRRLTAVQGKKCRDFQSILNFQYQKLKL